MSAVFNPIQSNECIRGLVAAFDTGRHPRPLEHDAEKLHDFSGNIMRQNKHLERNRDSELSHFALRAGDPCLECCSHPQTIAVCFLQFLVPDCRSDVDGMGPRSLCESEDDEALGEPV